MGIKLSKKILFMSFWTFVFYGMRTAALMRTSDSDCSDCGEVFGFEIDEKFGWGDGDLGLEVEGQEPECEYREWAYIKFILNFDMSREDPLIEEKLPDWRHRYIMGEVNNSAGIVFYKTRRVGEVYRNEDGECYMRYTKSHSYPKSADGSKQFVISEGWYKLTWDDRRGFWFAMYASDHMPVKASINGHRYSPIPQAKDVRRMSCFQALMAFCEGGQDFNAFD